MHAQAKSQPHIVTCCIEMPIEERLYKLTSVEMPRNAQIDFMTVTIAGERLLTIPGAFIEMMHKARLESDDTKKTQPIPFDLLAETWIPFTQDPFPHIVTITFTDPVQHEDIRLHITTCTGDAQTDNVNALYKIKSVESKLKECYLLSSMYIKSATRPATIQITINGTDIFAYENVCPDPIQVSPNWWVVSFAHSSWSREGMLDLSRFFSCVCCVDGDKNPELMILSMSAIVRKQNTYHVFHYPPPQFIIICNGD